VSVREREGLITRIRQIRRVAATAEKSAPTGAEKSAPAGAEYTDATRLDALDARIAHLEQLVEGLQDSVHREAERQGKLIAELQEQVKPEVMEAALSKSARERRL
jgi:uncharacterized coiled-coil protein SlyX